MRESIQEQRIKVEEPELRLAGSSLFAELDEWDFSASRLPSYRKVLRRLGRVDEQLYGETKFFQIARWQLATNTTALEGWCTHLPWWVRVYFGIYLLFWVVSVSAGLGASVLGRGAPGDSYVSRIPW